MGWQDDPITTPVAQPAAAQPWESDPITHASEGPRVGHGIGDAATAGYQGSIAGLADRGRLPDVVLDPQHAPWYEKLVAGGSQLFHEAPEMFAGGVAGAAAGGLAGPLGAAIGGGAGAFAVPTAIRESLIQAYSKGAVTSSGDFLDRASIVLQHTGKDALVGALTGGAGRAAEVLAAPLLGQSVMAGSIGASAARVGTEAAKLGAEGATLTVAPAALEGRLPEPEDFLNTAIMLAGLKGAHITAGRLQEIYARTGKTPMEVAADARIEPTLMEDLVAPQDFAGTVAGVHGSELPLDVVKSASEVPEDARYDGNGGVWGDGFYSAEAGDYSWFKGSEIRMPDYQHATAVESTFKRAAVITPDTVIPLLKKLGAEQLDLPEDMADLIKKAGYDGVIVRGFDAESIGATEAKMIEAGVASERSASQSMGSALMNQVVHFAPESGVKVTGADPAMAPLLAQRQTINQQLGELAKQHGFDRARDAEYVADQVDRYAPGGREYEEPSISGQNRDYMLSKVGADRYAAAKQFAADAAKLQAELAGVNGGISKLANGPVKPADPLAEYGPELPRAYQDLAREVNTRDAVPEPSPEAARAFVDKPFAEVPQLPGEPVLPTHVNYNYLNTPDDVKGALSRLSELYTQRITEQTRGTVSWEETYQQARTIYEQTTGEKLPAAPDGANYRNLAADLYAQKQLLISGVEQLMTLRNDYAAARAEGRSTPQQQLELLAQVERVATAQATTRGAQAEVGRALNILKSTNRDKGYYDALNKVIDGRFAIEGKLGDRNFDRMVDLMGDLGSPAEALAFAGRASRATTWDKIVEAWKSGLVSGPITQIANIMGNATFMATRPFVDLTAAAIGLARSSPDRVTAAEPLARVVGNIQGVFDAAKVAASVLRHGQVGEARRVATGAPPVPPGMTRIYHGSATHGRYDGKAWFSTDRKYAENYRPGAELQYVDYPTDKLNAIADPDGYGQTVDKGFTVNLELDSSETGPRQPYEAPGEKTEFVPVSDKAEVHREAIGGIAGDVVRVPFRLLSAADAFFRVLNERGEAYSLAVREAVGEGFNPATREFQARVLELARDPTQAMQDAIDAAGTRFTFNTPLGPAGQSIQAAIRKTHSEWMIPFVQTPANVAKEMLRLTPLAPIVGEWREAIAAGGAARDQAIAEMAAGTAASVAVFSLALSGHISGAGDPDPKKRAVAMAGGWQPYSIKVGDTWYSYGRLQPVGTVVGMAADMANAWQHFTPEESDKVPKILATAFANAITNQTFLQGITQVINAISDPDRNGARFVQGMAASVVPAVVGQTAQMMDPYQREIDSVGDAVKARIPGLNTELFPKRDPFGEPVPAKDRMGAITPITSATESDDKVRQEAKRLEIGVAKAPDHIELPAGHDKKLGKVALTPEQQDIFATEAGHLAYHVLNQLVHQPTWDNMPDMAQTNAMNLVFEHARKAGRAAAVGPEQMARESDRIANELRNRMAQGK